MILFLDFDGVLHPQTDGTFSRMLLLEALLQSEESLRIVVSSSWRITRTLAQLREPFHPLLRQRVIDKTPVLKIDHRQLECETWARRHHVKRFIAVDDQPWRFSKDCPWLVICDTATGLTEDVVSRIRAAMSTGSST